MVSIVIPTYNRADLLPQAIESALNQTYGNREVTVIDDGSTDSTSDVCRKYTAEGQISYIRKSNGGIGSALNRGILEMRGEWFKWLSSDDYLEPEAVELLLQKAEDTGAKVVYSSYRLVDAHGKVVGLHAERDRDYVGFAADLVRRHIGNGSSILMHRSVFEKVGLFDEGLKAGEDYDFWLRACLLHKYRFRCVEAYTLNYRVHEKQLTVRLGERRLANQIYILKRILQQIEATDPVFYSFLEYQLHPHTFGEALKHARRLFFVPLPKPLRRIMLDYWFRIRARSGASHDCV